MKESFGHLPGGRVWTPGRCCVRNQSRKDKKKEYDIAVDKEFLRNTGRLIAQKSKRIRQESREESKNIQTRISNFWKDNWIRDIKNAYSPIRRAEPEKAFGAIYGTIAELFEPLFFPENKTQGMVALLYHGVASVGISVGLGLGAFGVLINPITLGVAAIAIGTGVGMEVAPFGLPLVPAVIATPFVEGVRSIARTATQVVEHIRFPNGQPRFTSRRTATTA